MPNYYLYATNSPKNKSKQLKMRYKYIVINKKGKKECFTGVFNSDRLAKNWFKKYGAIHKARGHDLIKEKVGNY